MAFFSKFLKNIKKRRPMIANRMGGFLRNRPQLMERLRNVRGMRGMGRSMMNPNMQFGIMGLNPMMARSMKAKMMGLPDPVGFQLPPQPGGGMPGRSSDIMPKEPPFGYNYKKPPALMPAVQGPYRTSPVLNIPPGMQTQIQPQPSGPIRSVIEPVEGTIQPPKEDFSGYLSFYDNPPVPGMAGGGGVNKEEPKEYPNEGLAALAASGEKGKEAVEAMGYRGGGGVVLEEQEMVDNDADMMNYQRALQNYQQFYFAQPEAFRKNLPHPDQMYNDQGNQGEQGIVALLT